MVHPLYMYILYTVTHYIHLGPCYRTTYHPGRILHFDTAHPIIEWEGIEREGRRGGGCPV